MPLRHARACSGSRLQVGLAAGRSCMSLQIWGYGETVTQRTLTPSFAGSNPAAPAKIIEYAGIAQLVEQRFRTAKAFGSTPNPSSIRPIGHAYVCMVGSSLNCYLCKRHSRVHTVSFERRAHRCDASQRCPCRCSSVGRAASVRRVAGSSPAIGNNDTVSRPRN